MIVHEFGHCLSAWLSSGSVSRVIIHPLAISRTDLAQNPHPLFVAWGGPIIGSLLPLIVFAAVKLVRVSCWYLFQFFAGFCLVVNGFYVAEDSFFRVADGGDIIRHGSPQWVLIAFGVAAIAIGFYLWNGLGPHFGLGEANGNVNRKAALGTFLVLLLVVLVELLVAAR